MAADAIHLVLHRKIKSGPGFYDLGLYCMVNGFWDLAEKSFRCQSWLSTNMCVMRKQRSDQNGRAAKSNRRADGCAHADGCAVSNGNARCSRDRIRHAHVDTDSGSADADRDRSFNQQ